MSALWRWSWCALTVLACATCACASPALDYKLQTVKILLPTVPAAVAFPRDRSSNSGRSGGGGDKCGGGGGGGRSNADSQPPSRPVNEQYPHAVLFGPTCGGTIISPTWIITAAHCTIFTRGVYILAGTNNSADGSGVRVNVKRHVLHPRFTVGPYWLDAERYGIKQVAARFDFLLVELRPPGLTLDGTKMAAAKLDFGPVVPPGLGVAFAGFGALKHGETMSSSMHAMHLKTITDESCAQRLPEFVAQDMLCAVGFVPRCDSACNGDSGSGLVVDGHLLGVASWVENDARDCHPGAIVVFSRISTVREWIFKTTGI